MNRYPLWKYLVLAAALLIGLIYTLPNFYGEAPAVQVSSARATVKVNPDVQARVEAALQGAKIAADFVQLEGTSVRARFANTDVQLRAKDAISAALNRDPANHQVTVAITHLSEFAFFATAPTSIIEMPEPDGNAWKVFLPTIGR